MELSYRNDSHSLKLNLDEVATSEHLVRSPTPIKTLRIDLDTELKDLTCLPKQDLVSHHNHQSPVKYGNLILKVKSRPN